MSLWPSELTVETIDLLYPLPAEADYGDLLHLDWSDPIVVETMDAAVQVMDGPETLTDDRDAVTHVVSVFVPGHHPLLSGWARFRWQGRVYAIDGAAPYQPDPLGLGLDHHAFVGKEPRG